MQPEGDPLVLLREYHHVPDEDLVFILPPALDMHIELLLFL